MKKIIWMAVLLLSGAAQAAKVTEFNGADQVVSANVNNQGLSGGAVPWSMTSVRSPASGYTGPIFFGGCSNSSGGWAQWRMSDGVAPSLDYINTQDATTSVGDKGWTVVMLTGATHSVTGYAVNIIHYQAACTSSYRFVAMDAASSNFYITAPAAEFTGSTLHTATRGVAGVTWYNYNPASSMAAIGGTASWQPSAVSAFGLYVEVTAGNTAGLGSSIRQFTVFGEAGTQYTLTVNANPGGTATGGGVFGENTVQQITASPSNGFVFVNWTGAVTSVNSTTNVLMNANKTVWANFGPEPIRATTFVVR